MKKIGLGIVIAIMAIAIGTAIYYETSLVDECTVLRENLDDTITTDNERLSLRDKTVGGTLIAIAGPLSSASGQNVLSLTFKGLNKEGIILFNYGQESQPSYQIGTFYSFDLNNIRLSGAHSGEFFGDLKEIDC